MTDDVQTEGTDPRLGTTLNERYEILRKIGAGGMGIVYEGRHVLIQRRVAIKMLHAQFSQHAEVLLRFRREAIAATTIRHPHIVEVMDMGTAPDGAAYMVLEFLEGRDWSDDIDATGAQPLGKVARILRQVCEGLQAAHDKNIVHRDLKAENVFLAQHGSQSDYVKIVDFGISKMLDEPESATGKNGHSITKTGAAMGTPYAMAPEQMKGLKDVDRRADLWALGVMAYRALTGAYPFDGETFPLLAVNVLTADPRPLADYRRDLPPAVQEIVTRLLSKDPSHRFQHAREVRDALAPFESALDTGDARAPSMAMAQTMTPEGSSAVPPTNVNDAVRVVVAAPSSPQVAASSLDAGTPIMSSAAAVRAALQSAGVALPPAGATGTTTTTTGAGDDRRTAVPGLRSNGGPGVVTGVVLTLVLLTLGGGGALIATRTLGPSDPPPTSAAPPASGATPPPPETRSVPSTPAPTVAIHLEATPAAATMTLDGNPIANPSDVELPSGPDVHHLEVSAEGYATATREVSAAFPSRITVALERASAGHRPRTTTAPATTAPATTAAPPSTAVTAPVVHDDPPPSVVHETPPPPTTGRPLSDPFHRH